MKDKTRLLKLLNDFNIPYKIFTEEKYIHTEAVKCGAVKISNEEKFKKQN
jgi:hypothetical protein